MLKITVSVEPLTESNCYILAEGSHCVIIDPGESENLLRILKENKWEPELLLLTHEHCDHMADVWTPCAANIRPRTSRQLRNAMPASRTRS